MQSTLVEADADMFSDTGSTPVISTIDFHVPSGTCFSHRKMTCRSTPVHPSKSASEQAFGDLQLAQKPSKSRPFSVIFAGHRFLTPFVAR